MIGKRCLVCRVIVAVTLALIVPSAASAALLISEVMPQTTMGTSAALDGDWWELTNTGLAAVNLSGHSWGDEEDTFASGETNFFPNVSINPGQSIIVAEENASSETTWRLMWGISGVTILSQDEMVDDATPDSDIFSGLGGNSDNVFLYAPGGALLDAFNPGGGWPQNTRGVSFERGLDGTDLGLSVPGENFGKVAANMDIGSPGRAGVPEPTTALMALLGSAVLSVLFRKRD